MYESRGITQYYQANPYESEKHEYGFIDSDRVTEEFYKQNGNTVWARKVMKQKKDPSSIMLSSHMPRQNRKINLAEIIVNGDSEKDYFIEHFQEKNKDTVHFLCIRTRLPLTISKNTSKKRSAEISLKESPGISKKKTNSANPEDKGQKEK